MPQTQRTTFIGGHLICEEEARHFNSVKQRDMFIRLHKTKCKQCREFQFVDVKRQMRIKCNEDPQKHKTMEEIIDIINANKLGLTYKPK